MTKKEYNKIQDIILQTIHEIKMSSMESGKKPIEKIYEDENVMGYFGGEILGKIQKLL